MTNANLSKDYDGDKVNQSIFSTADEQFNMTIDPHSMQHIISRLTDLYNDPIVATVREIISNAIDATLHIDPEHRQPIDITVPGTFNHEFIVTDHALGLTLDEVKNIYTRYGASTKRADFSQIGAYGLGSKSPLSYTSSFNVRTAKDGYETELLISIENGQNAVKVLSHNKTDKANYMSVIIPTRESDADDFARALFTYTKNPVDGIKFNGLDYVADEFGAKNIITVPIKTLEYKGTELQLGIRYDKTSAYGNSDQYFVFNDELSKLARLPKDDDEPKMTAVLQGFEYSLNNPDSYFFDVPHIVIDIVPGLVDFSSSRDTITNTPRKAELVNAIIDCLKNDNTELVSNMIDAIPQIGLDPDIARLRFVDIARPNRSLPVSSDDTENYNKLMTLSNGKSLDNTSDLNVIAFYNKSAEPQDTSLPNMPYNSSVRQLKHIFYAYYTPNDFMNDDHIDIDDDETAETIREKATTNLLSTYISITNFKNDNHVLIITDVHDAKTASKLVSSRNVLSGSHYDNIPDDTIKYSAFAITDKSADKMNKILDDYMLSNDHITVLSADDTLELVKTRRSQFTSTRTHSLKSEHSHTTATNIMQSYDYAQMIDILDGSAYKLMQDTDKDYDDCLKIAVVGRVKLNDILTTFNELQKQNKKGIIVYRYLPDNLRAYDKKSIMNDYDLVFADDNSLYSVRSRTLADEIKSLAQHNTITDFTFADNVDNIARYKISLFNLALQIFDNTNKTVDAYSQFTIGDISGALYDMIAAARPELYDLHDEDNTEYPNAPISRRVSTLNSKPVNITNQYDIFNTSLDKLVDLFDKSLEYAQQNDMYTSGDIIMKYLAYKKVNEMFK